MLDYINLMMIDIEIPAGYNKGKPLTKAQKNLVQQLDVYFKMKEAECEKVLNKNYEEIKGLQKNLPEMENRASIVSLFYSNYRLFHKAIREGYPQMGRRVDGLRQYIDPENKDDHYFIGDMPVCFSLYKFYLRFCRRDMNLLAELAEDIPQRLENILTIEQEVRLCSSQKII